MLVFRIFHKQYGDPLFCPGVEGRWNSAGKKVLYCSESIPLAFMESMIRRQGVGFNNDFRIAHIEIPGTAGIKIIKEADLPPGWNDPHDYTRCKPVADEWYDKQESLVLQVPSAVLSPCNNYVLNSIHPDFSKIKPPGITPLVPDARIDDLLKQGKRVK